MGIGGGAIRFPCGGCRDRDRWCGREARAEGVTGVGLTRNRRVVLLHQERVVGTVTHRRPSRPFEADQRLVVVQVAAQEPLRARAGHTSWPSVGTEPLCRYGACAQMPCSMSAL